MLSKSWRKRAIQRLGLRKSVEGERSVDYSAGTIFHPKSNFASISAKSRGRGEGGESGRRGRVVFQDKQKVKVVENVCHQHLEDDWG